MDALHYSGAIWHIKLKEGWGPLWKSSETRITIKALKKQKTLFYAFIKDCFSLQIWWLRHQLTTNTSLSDKNISARSLKLAYLKCKHTSQLSKLCFRDFLKLVIWFDLLPRLPWLFIHWLHLFSIRCTVETIEITAKEDLVSAWHLINYFTKSFFQFPVPLVNL